MSGGFTNMSGTFYTNANTAPSDPFNHLGPYGVLVQNNDLVIQSNGVAGGSKWRLEAVSAVVMIVSHPSAPAIPDKPLPSGTMTEVTDCINVN
jgi:hypothetical protein